ncbi:MAG: hypothetical protein ACI81T_000783 [Bacteroidia bacterium]|jgi:hypothetical protein
MKSVNYIVLFCLFLISTSCISEQEGKAIKSAADLYGTTISYISGVSTSTDDGEKRFIERDISESKLINELPAELIGSNVAYTFFKNMDKSKNYTHIVSNVHQSKKETKLEYSIDDLEIVGYKEKEYARAVESLKDKKYDELFLSVVEEFQGNSIQINEVRKTMIELDNKYGKITDYAFHGFTFTDFDTESGNLQLIQIFGILKYDKENMRFSLFTSQNKQIEEEHYGFRFNW